MQATIAAATAHSKSQLPQDNARGITWEGQATSERERSPNSTRQAAMVEV